MTHPSIDQTILYASQFHHGQRDKAGVPYIAHPLAVMRRVPEEAWHVAVLHDVIEDSGVTLGWLMSTVGYTSEEVAAIDALSKRPGEDYEAFTGRIIAAGRLAILVKIADIDDNLDLVRLATFEEDALVRARRMKKYRTARLRLEMALEEVSS